MTQEEKNACYFDNPKVRDCMERETRTALIQAIKQYKKKEDLVDLLYCNDKTISQYTNQYVDDFSYLSNNKDKDSEICKAFEMGTIYGLNNALRELSYQIDNLNIFRRVLADAPAIDFQPKILKYIYQNAPLEVDDLYKEFDDVDAEDRFVFLIELANHQLIFLNYKDQFDVDTIIEIPDKNSLFWEAVKAIF